MSLGTAFNPSEKSAFRKGSPKLNNYQSTNNNTTQGSGGTIINNFKALSANSTPKIVS